MRHLRITPNSSYFLHKTTDRINPASVYQYYPLAHLWADVRRCLGHGLRLVNFATEALPTSRLLAEVFGRRLSGQHGPAARYDFRSRHAGLLGGKDGYLYPAEHVVAELRRFVAQERRRAA